MFSNIVSQVLLPEIFYGLCMSAGAQYGRIVDIDLKLPPRPPGYCFLEVFSVSWISVFCVAFTA